MRDVNSINKVILLGYVGHKPELRYPPQIQRPVATFSLATSEVFFNKNLNSKERRTEWHRINAWGPLAEFVDKYLNKGKQVLVEGKLRSRTWTDKNGMKRVATSIEANNIILIGRKEEIPSEIPDTYEEAEEITEDIIEEIPSVDEEEPPF